MSELVPKSNETYTNDPLEQTVATVVPIFFSIIVVTGFFGNCLVILVVCVNPQMRSSTTNLLIANLAVADLLFVVFCVPFTAADYMTRIWPFGLYWCRVVQYLIVVTAFASIYTLVLMSVDRFLAVVYPITSRSIRTEKVTKITIVALWIIILIVSSPALYVHGIQEIVEVNETYVMCMYLELDYISQSTYQICFVLSSYIIPLVVISGLYIRLIMRLWQASNGGVRMSAESRSGRKRVTRLVVVVVVAFASLWFPIQTILLLKSLGWETTTPFTVMLQIISQILAYTSSCINPLLYAFLSDNFRKAFDKAVHCSSRYNHYSSNIPIQRRLSHGGRTSSTTI